MATTAILLIHTDEFSTQDLILNPEFFPDAKSGDIVEVKSSSRPTGVYLKVERFEDEQIKRNLQISLAKSIAAIFELQPRSEVLVRKVEPKEITADYIELSFRDQYIGRADMNRLKSSILGTCVHSGKKVVTLGIRAQVRDVSLNGEIVLFLHRHCNIKTNAGYVAESTKVIFRSESGKFFIFIQMSNEMWNFDEDGDLYVEKLTQGFLLELFQKWKSGGNNHVVSIVLFSRVVYGRGEEDSSAQSTGTFDFSKLSLNGSPNDTQSSESKSSAQSHHDFYSVVADWEIKSDWTQVLNPLKESIAGFRRDILQQDIGGITHIMGEITTASYGNILEAVNLALNPFDKHYIDRDLMRTGLSIIIVTPGTGLFVVDKKLCRLTTQRMIDNGIGLDLVSLSKPPLHSVPLLQFQSFSFAHSQRSAFTRGTQSQSNSFSNRYSPIHQTPSSAKYKTEFQTDVWDPLHYDEIDKDSSSIQTFYTVPLWMDISFWQPRDWAENEFMVRCVMPEIQQMSVMEEFGVHLEVDAFDHHARQAFMTQGIDGQKDTFDYDKYDEMAIAFTDTRESLNPFRKETGDFDLKKRTSSTMNFKKDFQFGLSPENPLNADTWRSSDLQIRNLYRPRLDDAFQIDRSNSNSLAGSHAKATLNPVDIKINSRVPRQSIQASHSPISMMKNVSFDAESYKLRSGMELNRRTINPSSYKDASPLDFTKISTKQSPPKIMSSQSSRSNHFRQNSVNPCDPSKDYIKVTSQTCRWQHVYPKVIHPDSNELWMNWKSLCTPASLPLTTEYFPTPEELRDFYEEHVYMVGVSDEIFPYQDNRVVDKHMKVEALMNELIGQRLAQGYQLIISQKTGKSVHQPLFEQESTSAIFSKSFESKCVGVSGKLTKPVYMCLGDHVHKLTFDESTSHVEVRRYVRRINYDITPIDYTCSIWPKGMPFYDQKKISFAYPAIGNYNWNNLDHLLSGYQDEMTDALKFWRTRFLLIPMETSQSTFSPITNDLFDDEEIRLAGFKKFTDAFEKARWIHPNERRGKKIQESTAIHINLTTLTVSEFVNEDIGKTHGALGRKSSRRSSHSNMQDEKSVKGMSDCMFAAAMQEANGVALKDRRWHFKLYEKTFIGGECVDWMIKTFSDIETRIEAVEFGNELLERGVFVHVLKKHAFLDGHYFYTVNKELLPPSDAKERMLWFKKMRESSSEFASSDTFDQYRKTSSSVLKLSKSMVIDLDPNKKSNRTEIAFLHYDTIHNPKHCYHFQIHWLVCTARLIEDMLSSWTRLAEKYGLKLIEAPVEQAQIKTPAKENPFQSVRYIPLSLQPPTEDASRLLLDDETISVSPQLYHIELLKHLDFILDFESDDLINTDMVEYSYSKTAHNHTQFVHKSGCAFVQIDEDGLGFYWITNRLLLTSSANFMSNVRASQGVNPEDVRRSVVKICEDPDALRVFYEDVLMRLKVTGVKIYSGSIHSL